MKWLQQQRKVEVLAAASQQEARQMSDLGQLLVRRVRTRLQQPGTLVWAFAAGALYATGQRKFHSLAFDPIRYVNTFALLWGLLAEKQTGPE